MYSFIASSITILQTCYAFITFNTTSFKDITKQKIFYSLILVMTISCGSVIIRPIVTQQMMIRGNIYCLPAYMAAYHDITHLELLIEWFYVLFDLFTFSAAFSSLILMIILLRNHSLLSNNTRSPKSQQAKLLILLILLVSSRLPFLLIRLLSLANFQILPTIYIWIVSTSVCIWPVGHPFVHSLHKLASKMSVWLSCYRY